MKKLATYRKYLENIETMDLKHYKKAMTSTAKKLSAYTADYAAGGDVSAARQKYWSQYAATHLKSVKHSIVDVHHHHFEDRVEVQPVV